MSAFKVETMNWLYDRGCPYPNRARMEYCAIRTGNVEVFKWLHEHNFNFNQSFKQKVPKFREEKIVAWAREMGFHEAESFEEHQIVEEGESRILEEEEEW